ncbi:MAG: type II toxin-antitoxin system HigB family toxin [Gammaproteobacteria bacterium]
MYPNQRQALMDLYKVLCGKNTQFETPEAMRQLFPTLDNFKYKDKWYVLNIGGNHLTDIPHQDRELLQLGK